MTIDTAERAAATEAPSAMAASVGASVWRLPEVRFAAAATALFALGGLCQLAGAPAWIWWALYMACYVAGGWDPLLSGLRALREKTLDVDLLMVVAAIGAAAIGQVLDGALLIVIFATSGALETVATHRTEESVRSLLDLAPPVGTRVDDTGEHVVPAAELHVGDIVVIRPGERVAADGRVVSGASEIDQSSITGEPLPVDKQPGDEVFAGTLNGTGSMRVRVERPAHESVVARVVAMVAEASATKSKTHLFIERVEQRYSVGMVTVTLALFVIPLLFGYAFQPTLLRAMTFMIVASPCAVVLATMPPLLASIANAGRHAVLVKSAVVMEHLASVDLVAFDKTGTLTEGVPAVVEVRPHAGWTTDDVLGLAAAAERPSEHPLAAAIVRAARERGLTVPEATAFSSVPGRGVAAMVEGRRVRVGGPAQVEADPQAAAALATGQIGGRTAVVVASDDQIVGVIALADRVRTDAADAVANLAPLTSDRPLLLTGDNYEAAQVVAVATGVEDVAAGLLPQDKVARIRELTEAGRRVMVVGDGVNDAPAMAAAHVGVAMGRNGSDLALQTADAVLVRNDLRALPALINLARRARRLVVANLIIAATFITALVVWDLAGHLPLPLGVAGHEGSTVIVGLNGLRLLSRRAWLTPARRE